MTRAEPRPRRWILVVDDDPAFRALMLDALEAAGYAVVGAEDGFVAEELIRDVFPDLIVLDLRMPRGSGWTLLDNLRKHPRWHAIPVLVVSGFLEDPLALPTSGLNVVGAVPKPVELADLLDKIRSVLPA